MVQISTGKERRRYNYAGKVDLVTSPNACFSPFPNAIFLYFSCADERGHYLSKCVVEQILVLGLKKQPSLVTMHSSGEKTRPFVYCKHGNTCSKEMISHKTDIMSLAKWICTFW